MNRLLACLLLALSASFVSPAFGSAADDALRQAARWHKGGDTALAVAVWRDWAERGNVDAAYNLAVIHQHGDGVAVDYAAAMRWYRFAAEKGDKVSQFQIGLMYQTGQGVAADAEEAHRWFTMHRRHHLHHEHTPQMQVWRDQARLIIDERDRREGALAARRDGAQVVAELRRRANMVEPVRIETAASAPATVMR
jgi:hypothetical protein